MKNKFLSFLLIAMLISASMMAQKSYWSNANLNRSSVTFENLKEDSYKISNLNFDAFKSDLSKAIPREISSRQSDIIMFFPNDEGELERFTVKEVSIFSPELADQFPNIKAYVGYGIETPGARIRFSVSPQGVQSMASFPNKPLTFTVPIAKGNNSQYITYRKDSRRNAKTEFECHVESESSNNDSGRLHQRDANDQILRTFRIAISATGRYTEFWDDGNNANGNAQSDAMAQIVSTLNRTNEVFEVDMAITFQLVSGTNIIFPDADTDPYGSFNSLLSQVQSTITSNVGEANYDIGHLFEFATNSSNLGNGVACLGCVCVDNQKASGVSAHLFEGENGTPYMSDYFDIDYVPHEIGHQMGGNHTWAFGSSSAGVAFEPGSGTTIMGYAGITAENDVQNHSDAYFHYNSILEMLNTVDVRTCWTSTAISNKPPVAEAGDNYTIPQGTAFILRGSATDSDGGDVLTYTWEQIDNGVSNFNNFGPTRTSGGTFRSRPPSTSPNRYMPTLSRIIDGTLTETNPVKNNENTSWETVSTVSRNLNFALTVRDRSEANGTGQFPQSSFDTNTITVDGSSGPFTVTSQSSSTTWQEGDSQTITWDVAGTNAAPVNSSTVNILLSIDGGQTFPFTLASATANDGTQSIVVPSIGVASSSLARVMVESNDNIFLAVNSANFTVQESTASVDEVGFRGFKLYPNPSRGDFKLEFSTSSIDLVELRVFDLAGRTVYKKDYNNVSSFFDEEVSLGNISRGIYLIRITSGASIATRKIVIE